MTTEVSHRWLDSVVTARTRLSEALTLKFQLSRLLWAADIERPEYSDDAEAILGRDGTQWRVEALTARIIQIQRDLQDAERTGSSMGPILLSLTEVIDAVNETILNTEALLSDVGQAEDPFIDRLEEHPAYERQ